MMRATSSRNPTFLFFFLLITPSTQVHATRAFPPWLGCDDEFANGVPKEDGECYAVDSLICRWQYDTGCREEIATYYYYIGGVLDTTDFDYLEYHKISITASSHCNRTAEEPVRSCVVKVDNESGQGPQCNLCTNDHEDYRVVTLEDCSNIPNVFPANQTQMIHVKAGKRYYFDLAYNETRCQHPYFATTPAPTLEMTSTLAPSATPSPSNETTSSPTEDQQSTTLAPSATNLRGSTTDVVRTVDDENDDNKPSTIRIVVHPKLKLTIPLTKSPPPSQSTLLTLLQDTNGFFKELLHQHVPSMTSFGMSNLETSIVTGEALFFNFTATLEVPTGSSVSSRQVATYMSTNRNLNHYLRRVLKPTFSHIRSVKAWIVASGVAVVGEKAPIDN